jgi:glucose dehydrogenase
MPLIKSLPALALVGLVVGLPSVFHSSVDTRKSADVNDARVSADVESGNNWMINGRTHDSKHFSPLRQINDKNVSNLGLA